MPESFTFEDAAQHQPGSFSFEDASRGGGGAFSYEDATGQPQTGEVPEGVPVVGDVAGFMARQSIADAGIETVPVLPIIRGQAEAKARLDEAVASGDANEIDRLSAESIRANQVAAGSRGMAPSMQEISDQATANFGDARRGAVAFGQGVTGIPKMAARKLATAVGREIKQEELALDNVAMSNTKASPTVTAASESVGSFVDPVALASMRAGGAIVRPVSGAIGNAAGGTAARVAFTAGASSEAAAKAAGIASFAAKDAAGAATGMGILGGTVGGIQEGVDGILPGAAEGFATGAAIGTGAGLIRSVAPRLTQKQARDAGLTEPQRRADTNMAAEGRRILETTGLKGPVHRRLTSEPRDFVGEAPPTADPGPGQIVQRQLGTTAAPRPAAAPPVAPARPATNITKKPKSSPDPLDEPFVPKAETPIAVQNQGRVVEAPQSPPKAPDSSPSRDTTAPTESADGPPTDAKRSFETLSDAQKSRARKKAQENLARDLEVAEAAAKPEADRLSRVDDDVALAVDDAVVPEVADSAGNVRAEDNQPGKPAPIETERGVRSRVLSDVRKMTKKELLAELKAEGVKHDPKAGRNELARVMERHVMGDKPDAPKGVREFILPKGETVDRPMADKGLVSYRYRTKSGHMAIGAKNHADAMNEAGRGVSNPSRDRLDVWDGTKYVPVDAQPVKSGELSGDSGVKSSDVAGSATTRNLRGNPNPKNIKKIYESERPVVGDEFVTPSGKHTWTVESVGPNPKHGLRSPAKTKIVVSSKSGRKIEVYTEADWASPAKVDVQPPKGGGSASTSGSGAQFARGDRVVINGKPAEIIHTAKNGAASVRFEGADAPKIVKASDMAGAVRSDIPSDAPGVSTGSMFDKIIKDEKGAFGVDELADSVGRVAGGAVNAASSAADLVSSTNRFARGIFERGSSNIARELGETGVKIKSQMQAMDNRFGVRVANQSLDARATLKGLSRDQRLAVGKHMNRRTISEDPKVIEAADRLREVLDRDMIEADALGFKRAGFDGVKGSGKAFPQLPNRAGRKFLEKIEKGGALSPKARKWAAQLVESGRADTLEQAQAMMRSFAEGSRLRGTVSYFEKTRIELPEEFVEWDADIAIPPTLERNSLHIEAAREWGVNNERLLADIEAKRAEVGNKVVDPILDFFHHEFGSKNSMDKPGADVARAIGKYETLSKLGLSVTSVIRNSLQTVPNTARYSSINQLKAAVKMPPVVWRFFKEGRRLHEELERMGAVRTRTSLADIEAPTGSITDKAMSAFQTAERGNQIRASLIARYGIESDMAKLAKLDKSGKTGQVLRGVLSLGSDTKGSIARRMEKVGISKEVLADWQARASKMSAKEIADEISSGKAISPATMIEALNRFNTDTNFPLTIMSKRLWWESSPWLRLAGKFKTFAVEQTRLVYDDILKEAFRHGNFAPLFRFMVGTFVVGEIYNIARDTLTGRQESLSGTLAGRENVSGKQVASRVMNNIIDGGGIGMIYDFTFGITEWALGPAFGTFNNAKDAASDVWVNPTTDQTVRAAQEFIKRDVAVSRQVEGIKNRVESLSGESNNAISFAIAKQRAREWANDKENPTVADKIHEDVAGALMGRTKFKPIETTQAIRHAGMQIAVGDTEDAADIFADILRDALADEEPGEAVKVARDRLKRARTRMSPLGPIKTADRADFLRSIGRNDAMEVMSLQSKWIENYNKAARLAVEKIRKGNQPKENE